MQDGDVVEIAPTRGSGICPVEVPEVVQLHAAEAGCLECGAPAVAGSVPVRGFSSLAGEEPVAVGQ